MKKLGLCMSQKLNNRFLIVLNFLLLVANSTFLRLTYRYGRLSIYGLNEDSS